MKVVLNTKDGHKILGQYSGLDENGRVLYARPGLGNWAGRAAADSVVVAEITTDEVQAEIDRLVRKIESAKSWVGGDSLTAMNTLVQVGVELAEYARVMGAMLSPEAAKTVLEERIESGEYYIGSRAHALRFEPVVEVIG